MKYTKQLWKPSNFNALQLIRGKSRVLKRLLLAPCQLVFEGVCVCLSSVTLPVDLYRDSKARNLKHLHFEMNYKPYVLQRWIN